MRSSVFVDLDSTLIRSYSCDEVKTFAAGSDLATGCRKTYAGILTHLRPGAAEMLSRACEVADVYLLTAAQLGYAKSVLNAFNLSRHFTRFYSTVYACPHTIGNDLKLAGSPWLLIDDLPPGDNMAVYKMHCLGLHPELAENPRYVERHYLQVPPYAPHLNPHDDAMEQVADTIQSRLKSLEKRMIKH